MPPKSKAQRRAMAIAKHAPEKLHSKNNKLLNMTGKQLSEYASSKEKGLPKKKRKKKR